MFIDTILDVMQYTGYVDNIANALYANKALYNESGLTRERLIKKKYIRNGKPTYFAKNQLLKCIVNGLPRRYIKIAQYLNDNNTKCPRFMVMFCPTVWDNQFRMKNDGGPYTFQDLMYWFNNLFIKKIHPSYSVIEQLIQDVANLIRKNEECINKFTNSKKLKWSKVELTALQNFYIYLSNRYFYMIG